MELQTFHQILMQGGRVMVKIQYSDYSATTKFVFYSN